jgi:hypothetical protein
VSVVTPRYLIFTVLVASSRGAKCVAKICVSVIPAESKASADVHDSVGSDIPSVQNALHGSGLRIPTHFHRKHLFLAKEDVRMLKRLLHDGWIILAGDGNEDAFAISEGAAKNVMPSRGCYDRKRILQTGPS